MFVNEPVGTQSTTLIQRKKGHVRRKSQLMDGHSILGTHNWMAQLQIRCKEGIGEGAYSWDGN